MAVDAAAEPRPTASRTIAALKDASGTALVALGLAVPILALRTEQNISNELILQPRWGYAGIAVLLAFTARLLYLLAPALPKLRKFLESVFDEFEDQIRKEIGPQKKGPVRSESIENVLTNFVGDAIEDETGFGLA
jgi:hypothetical protein